MPQQPHAACWLEHRPPLWRRRVALLVAGDAAALLLFATIGRVSHGEGFSLIGALGTAW